MTDENLIIINNLVKQYKKDTETITIFDNLHMAIKEHDFIAIMGPSGSGKTTLLNLLGGVDEVSSGEIIFNRSRIDNLSESELANWRANNIGFIFQFYHLMPMLSAMKNVELPLLLLQLDRHTRQERVKTALRLVNMESFANRYPKELSGGQQQRVAIARAIVANPKLLLCDEPTGDLDRKNANDILEMLKLLNQELGKTIIMVTHDPEAANYAKRILHLDKGKFIEKEMLS